MAKPKLTSREFYLARAFLKTLRGNSQNTYLILAVVAWMRAMQKAHDPYWKSLKGLSASAAGARLARKLLAKASGTHKAEYKAIIRRLREKHAKDKAMGSQAVDFIRGIEESHWDKKNYGFQESVPAHWERRWVQQGPGAGNGHYENVWVPEVPYKNPLMEAFSKLTNRPGIPNSWWVTVTKTKQTKSVPPRPSQPRSLLHVLPEPNYIQPYAVSRWYDAKLHYGSNILVND